METRKAHIRRLKSGFYAKYIQGYGIDIGCGRLETGDGEFSIEVIFQKNA